MFIPRKGSQNLHCAHKSATVAKLCQPGVHKGAHFYQFQLIQANSSGIFCTWTTARTCFVKALEFSKQRTGVAVAICLMNRTQFSSSPVLQIRNSIYTHTSDNKKFCQKLILGKLLASRIFEAVWSSPQLPAEQFLRDCLCLWNTQCWPQEDSSGY